MLACLEEQVNRANETKQSNIAHQKQIEQKVYLLMNTAILQLLSHLILKMNSYPLMIVLSLLYPSIR